MSLTALSITVYRKQGFTVSTYQKNMFILKRSCKIILIGAINKQTTVCIFLVNHLRVSENDIEQNRAPNMKHSEMKLVCSHVKYVQFYVCILSYFH